MNSKKLVIYTDGASKNNPGPAAIGVVIKDIHGETIVEISRGIGFATNNQAEYQAVIAALEKAIDMGAHQLELNIDSELLVRQVQGRYRVKNPGLKVLYQRLQKLQNKFESLTINQVPREQNCEADRLANKALSSYKA